MKKSNIQILSKILLLIIMLIPLVSNFFVFALIVPKTGNLYPPPMDDGKIANFILDYDIEINGCIPKDIRIGDTLYYGNYAGKPIEWIVVDKNIDEGKALLYTKYIIDTVQYNRTWNPTTWEECSLRKWLNESFYEVAFTDLEKEFILTTKNENSGNENQNVKIQNSTYDKVFLFSIEEIKKYFDTTEKMIALGTQYAIDRGLWISKMGTSTGYSVWWLRNPGRSASHASLMHAAGAIGYLGDGVATVGNGVRPSMWVKVK